MRPADAAAGAASPAPALIPRLLLLDARRPASWLAAGAAVACGMGGASLKAGLPAAVAAGGLLAVAAIGHMPARGLAAAGPGGGAWLTWLVIGTRAAWPAGAFLLAAAVTAARGASVAAPLAGALSAGCAAAAFSLRLLSGCADPQAATRALIGAGSAAAAALAAQLASGGGIAQAVAAGVAWGLVAAGGVVVHSAAAPAGFPAAFDTSRRRRTEAGAGPAMVAALAAMVSCYFLAPQFAWAYTLVAVGWFVAVAVPPATAPAGGIAAARLARSAAGRPVVPGSLRRAASAATLMAALLAWPAVVALVLPAVEGQRVGGPLLALAWLGGAAGLLVAVVALAASTGRTEDARAAILSLLALAGIAVGREAPSPPFFSGFSRAVPAVRGGNGVEPDGVFLQDSPVSAAGTVARCGPCCLSSDQPPAPDNSAFGSCRS